MMELHGYRSTVAYLESQGRIVPEDIRDEDKDTLVKVVKGMLEVRTEVHTILDRLDELGKQVSSETILTEQLEIGKRLHKLVNVQNVGLIIIHDITDSADKTVSIH